MDPFSLFAPAYIEYLSLFWRVLVEWNGFETLIFHDWQRMQCYFMAAMPTLSRLHPVWLAWVDRSLKCLKSSGHYRRRDRIQRGVDGLDFPFIEAPVICWLTQSHNLRHQGEWLFSQALSRSSTPSASLQAISELVTLFSVGLGDVTESKWWSAPMHSGLKMGFSLQLLWLMLKWIWQYKPYSP